MKVEARSLGSMLLGMTRSRFNMKRRVKNDSGSLEKNYVGLNLFMI